MIPDTWMRIKLFWQLKQASDQGRPVNVVLTETRTSTLDGIQATRLIKEQFPEVAVMVLTENINDSYVIDAIHAGAAGYIFLKDMAPEELLQRHPACGRGRHADETELLRTAVENCFKMGGRRLPSARLRLLTSPRGKSMY